MIIATAVSEVLIPRGPNWLWIVFGTVLHLFTFALVTIHCLVHRREATSSVLWILVSWFIPVVGPLLFIMFGVHRIPAKGWRKQKSDQEFLDSLRSREDEAMSLTYWRAVHEALATEPDSPFARELNNAMNATLSDYPLLGGNTITPLITGDEAFPAMLEAIRDAKDHIHVQTFIVGHDTTGEAFLDLLRQKAEAGVTVRLLFDRFGSTHALWGRLISKYSNIRNFHVVGWTLLDLIKRRFQVNLRNHRKILVVDGRVAFTGGMNLAADNTTVGETPPIRDYHFRVCGPVVQELQYSFLRDWYFMTDDDPEQLLTERHFPHIDPGGEALIRVVNGGPTSEVQVITDILFASIVSARKQILAVTPYFVPPPDILRALRSAAIRGVDVRLVVPLKNNHIYAGMASRALFEELLVAGVRIFQRRPPFIHAKALIVDDALAFVGTANMDSRSLHINYETNLAVYDEVFINALKRIVLEDVADSDELTLATWRRRPAHQRIVENFCHLLAPIL